MCILVHLGEKKYHAHGPLCDEVYFYFICIFKMGLWTGNTKPWKKKNICWLQVNLNKLKQEWRGGSACHHPGSGWSSSEKGELFPKEHNSSPSTGVREWSWPIKKSSLQKLPVELFMYRMLPGVLCSAQSLITCRMVLDAKKKKRQ